MQFLWQYQGKVEPLIVTVAFDKWQVQHFNQAVRKKARQELYQTFFWTEFETVRPPALDGWYVEHFNQAVRLKVHPRHIPYFDIDGYLLTQPENITLDKWIREPILPRWDKKRQQYSFPYSFYYMEEEPFEPFADLSEWFLNQNIPRWDRKRQQYTYQWFDIDPLLLTQSENITSDKFKPLFADIVFDRQRLQYMYPTWVGFEYQIGGNPCVHDKGGLATNTQTKGALAANSFSKEPLQANVLTKEVLHC